MKTELKADAQRVYALLTDVQFLLDRCKGVGDIDANCDIEEHDDVTEIRLNRKVLRNLPGFLSRLFDSEQTLKKHEEWRQDNDESWSGSYVVDIENQPVTITAKFRLFPTDVGCCYTIEHKVKSKIPLIGGWVGKYILGLVERGCAAELEYLREQL
jgi:hypothetical protein